MEVRPLEIVRVTLQMGPHDSVPGLLVSSPRYSHVLLSTCYVALATGGDDGGGGRGNGDFSPRNPAGLILKMPFDVDKSGRIRSRSFRRSAVVVRIPRREREIQRMFDRHNSHALIFIFMSMYLSEEYRYVFSIDVLTVVTKSR